MKISWIKCNGDKESFKFFKNIGMDVHEIENLETIDKEIENLVSEDYKTIVVSNEIAGFSEDIIKKYSKNKEINIIIAPSKK